MLLFFQLFALALATLLLGWAVGHGTLRLAGLRPVGRYFTLFLALLTGLTVLIGLYATVCTRGQTLQVPVLLLLAALLWGLRRSAGPSASLPSAPTGRSLPGQWRSLLLLAGLGGAVFGLQYLVLYDPTSPFLLTPFQDYVYYSRLTLPLNHGLETSSLETIYPQFVTEQPYHYFELWLNALLVRATGLPSVWVCYLSTAAVLVTGVLLGFGALLEHFNLRRGGALGLALLALGITGTVWPLLGASSFVANGSLLNYLPLVLHPKIAPIYLFVLLAANLLLRNRYVPAALALAVLPLLFVSTAPAAGAGVAGLALSLRLRRQITVGQLAGMVLPMVGVAAWLGLFYVLQPPAYAFPHAPASALRALVPLPGEGRTLLNIAIGALLNYALYYAGYFGLVLAVAGRRVGAVVRGQVPLLAWAGGSLLGAAVVRAIGHHFTDSFQFFSNPMVPISAVVVAAGLAAAIQQAARPVLAYGLSAAGLLALLLLDLRVADPATTRYSPTFLREVGPRLQRASNCGGFVLGNQDYAGIFTLAFDSNNCGYYVADFKNDYTLVSLSTLAVDSLGTDPRYRPDSAQARGILEQATLYRFRRLAAQHGQSLSPDSAVYRFVVQQHLGFVCVSKNGRLPVVLAPLVQTGYRDPYSGEKLYFLRQAAVSAL